LTLVAAMPLRSELHTLSERARESGLVYVNTVERTAQWALADRALALRGMAQFDVAFGDTKSALAKQTELLSKELERVHGEARAAVEQARLWLILAAAIALVVGWGFVALVGRSIRRSLTALSDVAHDVAAGQLDRRSTASGRDEVGQLAGSVNRMADNLQRMIDRMRGDAERAAFTAELTQAMDMADREPEAYRVVAHAMVHVCADHAMELLISDSSDAQLERAAEHPTAGAPGCGVQASFGCIAVRRGHAVTFNDSRALNACPRLRERPGAPQSAACVPVTFMGRALGVLHAAGTVDQPLTELQLDRMTTLGVQAGSRIGTVRAFERTQLQASTDTLTGLSNRRSVEQRIRRLKLSGQPFVMLMCDLDHFKHLNDTHGHHVGDEALRTFADVVRSCTRDVDIAGRWGGEEFVFVLADADSTTAVAWTTRLRDQLASTQRQRGTPVFTASFGVVDSSAAATIETLVRLSDSALYRAKAAGRNRTEVASAYTTGDALLRPPSEQRAAVDVAMLAETL
jgi:diguanylate cyclase (GGDEF)-like protein